MADATPQPELLRALGRLARGLSCLFWGLPLALVVCGQAVQWLRNLGIVPPVLTTGLLLYGCWLMGAFQPQERIWIAALNRTRLLAFVNLGLSPFLYWWSQVPGNGYFLLAVALFGVNCILFLASLNVTLLRLGAMLPDETLRQETRQFTLINRGLLGGLLALGVLVLVAGRAEMRGYWLTRVLEWATQYYHAALIALLLLPIAMTMALLWKTKEVILESVFSAPR